MCTEMVMEYYPLRFAIRCTFLSSLCIRQQHSNLLRHYHGCSFLGRYDCVPHIALWYGQFAIVAYVCTGRLLTTRMYDHFAVGLPLTILGGIAGRRMGNSEFAAPCRTKLASR